MGEIRGAGSKKMGVFRGCSLTAASGWGRKRSLGRLFSNRKNPARISRIREMEKGEGVESGVVVAGAFARE